MTSELAGVQAWLGSEREVWRMCENPQHMLRILWDHYQAWVTTRKRRLLAGAACHWVAESHNDPLGKAWSKHALHYRSMARSMEREADAGTEMGLIPEWEYPVNDGLPLVNWGTFGYAPMQGALMTIGRGHAAGLLRCAFPCPFDTRPFCRLREDSPELGVLVELREIRDFHWETVYDPTPLEAWLRWRNRLIARTAAEAYEQRDFSGLPVLADMLEEAGCALPAVLEHLRGPGPHARGCWVLDALLAKG